MNTPSIGDIVQIDWKDHFRYKGDRPKRMIARSWGMVDEIDKHGVSLIQNQCLNEEVCQRVMDGQHILRSTIVQITIIQKGGVENVK